MIDTTSAFFEEKVDDYVSSDENRQCKIRLHPEALREHIDLTWHNGARYKKSPTIRLKKKMTILAPIKRARAWFGFFTVPHDAESETDQGKVRDLKQLFEVEKARTLLAWGDYPRPRKLADGTDPIGPHRFPDVECNVTEWDGTEWGWIRLIEMYGVGKFDSLVFADPKAAEKSEIRAAEAENKALKSELAEMKGQIAALIALVKAPGKNAVG